MQIRPFHFESVKASYDLYRGIGKQKVIAARFMGCAAPGDAPYYAMQLIDGESLDSTVKYRTWTSGGGWSGELPGPGIGEVPNSMTFDAEPEADGLMVDHKVFAGLFWAAQRA